MDIRTTTITVTDVPTRLKDLIENTGEVSPAPRELRGVQLRNPSGPAVLLQALGTWKDPANRKGVHIEQGDSLPVPFLDTLTTWLSVEPAQADAPLDILFEV